MKNTLKQNRKKVLFDLIRTLELSVNNLELLNLALTHGSSIKGSQNSNLYSNERLEFFGDAVLKLFISEYILNKYPKYSEGQLSKLRAYVVSEKVLAQISKKLALEKYLLLGKNEQFHIPVSILADSLEALLAVIYFDCGFSKARDFVFKHWIDYIESADKSKEKENYKAALQEFTQGIKIGLPAYKTVVEKGPDHNKVFIVAVWLDNNEIARGTGKTKKEAGQDAAKNALIVLEEKRKK